jgi:gas vesicle protein
MADRHDQAETRDTGGAFLMGLLAGTALGAGLGMLLAPKAGVDLRGDIRRRAHDLGQRAADRYREAGDTASCWAEHGRETVDRVQSAVTSGAEEVRRFTARTAGEQPTSPTATNPPFES